jgi:hypothetical protein
MIVNETQNDFGRNITLNNNNFLTLDAPSYPKRRRPKYLPRTIVEQIDSTIFAAFDGNVGLLA